MSKSANDSRPRMIGCNIKPGHKPGGFSLPFRKRKSPGAEKIKAAADRVLTALGLGQAPTPFDSPTNPPGKLP